MQDPAESNSREAEAQHLRSELKQWENAWAKEHAGKKPSREDIKQNPEIAQKYKTYNKLRDILSGKAPAPPKQEHKSRKRKSAEQPAQTPSKRFRAAETPSKSQQRGNAFEAAVTPSLSRKLFSPVVPTSIGPTPQRDGRVLGLFDLLVQKDAETPSKGTGDAEIEAVANVEATPSKQTSLDAESVFKLGRTPVSSGKRHMLDSFMTPLKNRDGNAGARTPTSISKLQFATPSFLRRAPMPTVDENGEFVSPQPIRLPRKPLVRGLSSVVASLRKMEEEQLDDELEALHEMESEGAPQAPKLDPKPKPREEVLVEDSQVPNRLLGGFDDEAMYDSPPEDALDRNGQPLRVFKKKGQKRTTRRSNMKPTRVKRPVAAGDDDGEGSDDDDVVPETQVGATKQAQIGDTALMSGSEFEDSEAQEDEDKAKAKTKKKNKAQNKKPEAEQGKIKRAVRKVNELAHTNFKRLKLRNNGAKGGPGYNSRFRRRR
ncbi:DNA replication/checkpoint protein [Pleurostoma richardsiae]|uniref:DNA replication regulator SLD2 n=1 Tax=Pleurostoma richardsiae TaxID=41990 RepID=A0AA38VRH6_9PEZI|nr:DNA replication/checkpoint protein [Pleurostoma richardsiae]